MKVYQTIGYAYDELGEQAQKKVRDDVQKFLYVTLDSDWITTDVEYALRRAFGMSEDDDDKAFPLSVSWNASHSQGDYVGLDGDVTPEQVPDLPVPADTERIFFTTRNGWGVSTDVYVTTSEGDDEDAKELAEAVREACEVALRAAYDSIESLTSDEAVRVWIVESEDYYTEDGTVIPSYMKETNE